MTTGDRPPVPGDRPVDDRPVDEAVAGVRTGADRLGAVLRVVRRLDASTSPEELLRRAVDLAGRVVPAHEVTLRPGPWPGRTVPYREAGCLEVPILVDGEVRASLVLTGRARGTVDDLLGFTAEDELVLEVVASGAGVAVAHAELVAELRRRQGWQAASAELTTNLLAGRDPDAVLGELVARARELSGSDAARLARPRSTARETPGPPGDDGTDLLEVVTVASEVEPPPGAELPRPREDSLSGIAAATRETVVIESVATDPRTTASAGRWPGLGPAVAAPLVAEDELLGVLAVARFEGRPPYTDDEVATITAFARDAALAMRLAGARRERERARLFEQRESLAGALHSRVAGDLTAIATDLHALAARLTAEERRRALDLARRTDDATWRMGSTIFPPRP